MDAALIHEIKATDLLSAYRAGIFPMAEASDDPDIFWMAPEMRGIIPLDDFHIPASLKKTLKKQPYRVTINRSFEAVIESCGAQTPVRAETWINQQIREWFIELHHMGHTHSVECWDAAGNLAGGLYGMAINGAFFGESMFSQQTDASKIALVHLVVRLKKRGFSLLDTQFVNDHLLQFGCREIPRDDYHSLLEAALSSTGVSFVDSASAAGSSAGVSGATSSPDACVSGAVISLDSEVLASDWASLTGSLQSRTLTS